VHTYSYIIIYNFTREEFVDERNDNNNNNSSSADGAAFYIRVTARGFSPLGKYNNINA